MFNVKVRGRIAKLLILVLFLTGLPTFSFAGPLIGAAGSGPVELHMDYLGKGTKAAPGLPADAPVAVGELKADDVVWIGIRAEKMTKTNYGALENYGLQQWQMSFNYDNRYLVPFDEWDFEAGEATAADVDSFRSAIKKACINTSYENTAQKWHRRYVVSSDTTDIDMELNTIYAEPSNLNPTTARMLSLKIDIPDTRPVTEQRFYASTDDSAAYLFKFPMKVVSPAPAGTLALEMALTAETFTVVISNPDATNDDWTGCWVSIDGIKTDDQNLKKRFKYFGNLPLFPAAEEPTGVDLVNAPALTSLTKNAPIPGLDAMKVSVTYPTNPTAQKTPTGVYMGSAGDLENKTGNYDPTGLASLTTVNALTNITTGDSGKTLYAYYTEGTKHYLIKVGVMTVLDPVTAISIGTIGAATYGDKLYEKLPATITATGGSVPAPAKTDVTWSVKRKTAPDTEYVSLEAATVLNAGEYTVKAEYGGQSDTKDVTIAKKSGVTIVADNKTITYGDAAPTYTFTVTGFAKPEDEAKIKAAVTAAPDKALKPVNAPITIVPSVTTSNSVWNNYEIPTGSVALSSGTLTVNQKQIAPVAELPAVKVGINVPADTSYELPIPAVMLVGTDTVKLSFKLVASLDTATEGATKTVNIKDVSLTGADALNYVMVPAPTTATYNVVSKTLSGIVKVAGPTKALDSYNEGANLDLTGLKLDLLYGADPKETFTLTSAADPKFDGNMYLAAPGLANAAAIKTGTLVNNNAVVNKAAMNGKALYYVADNYYVAIGTLKVKGKKADPAAPVLAADKAGIKLTPPTPATGLKWAVVANGAPAPSESDYRDLPAGGIFTKTTAGAPFTANTQYDVYVIAVGDAEDAASNAVKTSATTMKNLLTVKNAADVKIAYGFVNDTVAGAINSKADIDALLATAPGALEYYQEKELTNKFAYGTTPINSDLTIYAKMPASGGGSPGIGGSVTTPEEKSLKIVPDSLSGLPGDTQKIKVEMKGISGDVTFKSGDEKVATVDKDGNVKFVAIGSTTITAEVAGVKATAKVEVLDPDASLIDVDFLKPFIFGYPDGTFRPDDSITRAEVSAIISRILKVKKDDSKRYPSSFADVPADEWYADYVGYLTGKGVIEGRSESVFDPQGKLTRSEFVALLARAARFKAGESVSKFTDVPDTHWAKAYILVMSEKSVIGGYPDGTFGPDKSLTRAEAAKIVLKMLKDSDALGTTIASDMTNDHWAYNEVLKAMNNRKLK